MQGFSGVTEIFSISHCLCEAVEAKFTQVILQYAFLASVSLSLLPIGPRVIRSR